MDFKLTDEQELFVAGVRELMERENWEAYFADCDEKHEYPERWVKELADLGIDTMLLPEEHGGMEAGMVTLAAIWEELGRQGAPTYVLYQLPGFSTILREGTQEQIDKIFAFRGTGKQMWNSAITEPSAGSDVGSLKTTYTRKNGKVYLNGQKCFITSSGKCPYLVVMARDAESEKPVFSEWFVDMSLPGIKKNPLEKLGLRMDSCCEIVFDNVELEEKDMFGKEGNGFLRVKEEFDAERFLVACTNYGVAYCAFEDAAKYANQRVQFGEAIGRTQLIQEKFAHMAIKLNSMKNMIFESAWKCDNGTMTSGDAAMCKYFCANAAFDVVDNAMQVLAGYGVAGGHRVARFWRDLRVDRVSGGSDEMQILTLGRAVLKQYR
ncbi:crotonobetainyl-CoA dehydrogenase [Desulfobaculum bizertense]|uniref:Crotonobetainyl-CoA dehydrogenase n=1 Tax=Desulfobaculum bizertense DSM 18034 TaxID=1121442 RepID=A0A1T4VR71_9BACT|nr:crotonobetainyl-CoA dehydrogenase [Desulfobaculum bizertense]UIJ38253.1 crotonobetainyl-CoA dehydrogenase [Desulfobaculum bizertense]SKA66991.1 crotonobetainyl-CoA dehydrogenase [Desulfobaculum bizertense DSM 18034]